MTPQHAPQWGPHRESPFHGEPVHDPHTELWPQSAAAAPPAAAVQRSRSPFPLVAMAVVAGGLLVVGGALGAVLLGKARGGGATGTPVASVAVQESTHTSTTTTTVTAPVETTAPPIPRDASSPIVGTDSQGFTTNPARCNVDDPAMFIGRTPRSSVVICRAEATGGLYYVGYAGGQRSPDVSWPDIHGSTYTFGTRGATYEVGPDALRIRLPDRIVTEPWIAQWRG